MTPWIAGESSYFGTTLVSGIRHRPDAAEQLHRRLSAIKHLIGAADLVDERFLLVRLMAVQGPAFHKTRRAILTNLQSTMNDSQRR